MIAASKITPLWFRVRVWVRLGLGYRLGLWYQILGQGMGWRKTATFVLKLLYFAFVPKQTKVVGLDAI